MVKIPDQKRKKLDKKSTECIFLRHADDAKAYRLYDRQTKKVITSRDVEFFEDCRSEVEVRKDDDDFVHSFELEIGEEFTPIVDSGGEILENEPTIEQPVTEGSPEPASAVIDENASINIENNAEETDVENETSTTNANDTMVIDEDSFESVDDTLDNERLDPTFSTRAQIPTDARPPSTRSGFPFSLLNHHVAFSVSRIFTDEPKTFRQAMECEDKEMWVAAMKEEYLSLVKNETWKLVVRPSNRNVIDNRWVYKIKRNTDGSVERYKARLVARGFSQEYGFDYLETFSPVVRFTSIRTMLSIAAQRKMVLRQFDVKTAFLNGDLLEDIFMEQPAGFADGSNRVCKLQRSLYGLKQASRCWNQKFKNFISMFGFNACEADPCVFVSKQENKLTILAIHVDDGLIASDNKQNIDRVVHFLQEHFEIKAMPVGCFLGLEIDQRSNGSIFVHQSAYTKRVLNKFNMDNCNSVATPSDPNQVLHNFGESEKSTYPYREAVGSLMYLSVGTRPDITHAVGLASRYLENPTVVHENHVKRIFKYLKGTINFGLLYFNSEKLRLTTYSDADHAGDIETRRSTTGYVFMIGDGIVSWGSERQKSVSISTMEAEYMAASEATRELIWLKRLLREIIPITLEQPIFFMDNLSAIRLVKNPEFHKRSKHIEVRFHFIREKFENGEFSLEHIASCNMLADMFTKSLPKERFQYLRSLIGIAQPK